MFQLDSEGWSLGDIKDKNKYHLEMIDYKTAINFLLPRHYSGRKPNVKKAFGWYEGDKLVAVCTFGKPASNFVCKSICGEKFRQDVYELNRLCRLDEFKGNLSQFVGACLRDLKVDNWIIISYSDTAMNHHGYVYQACNFIYAGKTKKQMDRVDSSKSHPRHATKESQYRTVRSEKYRYLYFCTGNKKLKKEWLKSLRFKIEHYPKGDNKNYKLGDYLKPVIFEVKD